MKKVFGLLVTIAMSLFTTYASAQYIPVITSPSGCVVDGSGTAIANGSMIVIGTDQNDNPVVYRAGSTNMVTTAPITRTITAGSLATSLQLADPANSSPLNVSYRFAIQDSVSKKITVYKGINITANDTLVSGSFTTFNFCKMSPGAGVSTFGGFTTPSLVNGDWTVTRDLSVGRNETVAGTSTLPQINNHFYVDGTKYTYTQAGLQQAMNDPCSLSPPGSIGPNLGGNTVVGPGAIQATSLVSGALWTSNCPLDFSGVTSEGTILLVNGGITGVTTTTPVIHAITTSGSGVLGYHFHDFKLQCNTGCPTAGAAIQFDNAATAQGPQRAVVERVEVIPGSFNGYSIDETGTSNGMFAFHIHDNQLDSIRATSQMADSQLIEHNLLRPIGTLPCIDITMASGAALGLIIGNNCQPAAGDVVVHGAIQPKILYNQFENVASCTEINASMIDFLGDAFGIDGGEISGNNLNAHTVCTTNVRLGANTTNTVVKANKINVAATGTGIRLIAGTTGNIIAHNSFQLNGGTCVTGDTVASRTTISGNIGCVGEPGIRSWASSDGDAAGDFARNSATQTQGIVRILDENLTMLSQFDKAGRLYVGAGTGFGPNSSIFVQTTSPAIDWGNTSGAADAKVWDMSTTATTWQMRTINDANNNALPIITINRSGLTPTSIINTPVVQNSFNRVAVASNFTTANNTSLQAITGLSWALPAEARSYSFHCAGSYSQATALVAVSFGIQASSAPTNIFANGAQQITAGPPATEVNATLPTLTTTTATNIVSGTPGALTTNYIFYLDGTIEIPAVANTINIMVGTAAGADAVTVLRGSWCRLF